MVASGFQLVLFTSVLPPLCLLLFPCLCSLCFCLSCPAATLTHKHCCGNASWCMCPATFTLQFTGQELHCLALAFCSLYFFPVSSMLFLPSFYFSSPLSQSCTLSLSLSTLHSFPLLRTPFCLPSSLSSFSHQLNFSHFRFTSLSLCRTQRLPKFR